MILHSSGQFDNHAVHEHHIEAMPLAAAMGAEMSADEIVDHTLDELAVAVPLHSFSEFRLVGVCRASR